MMRPKADALRSLSFVVRDPKQKPGLRRHAYVAAIFARACRGPPDRWRVVQPESSPRAVDGQSTPLKSRIIRPRSSPQIYIQQRTYGISTGAGSLELSVMLFAPENSIN